MAQKKTTRKKPQTPLWLTILVFIIIIGIYLFTDYDPFGIRPLPTPTPTPAPRSLPTPTPIATPPATATPAEAVTPFPQGVGNTTNESFEKAKRLLLKLHIDAKQTTEFYCGSTFDAEGVMNHSKSGFKYRKNAARANRLEWEHVVPAEAFGNAFAAWRDGDPACVDNGKAFKGRDCAEKVSAEFRLMQADMYNLQPAIGEVNGDRSNYSYTMLEGEAREYGACNMEIDAQKAEPPDNRFGDIARTYWYMDSVYPGRGIVSEKNVKLFEAWNKLDPVDAWECERAQIIEKLQGNVNMILQKACAGEALTFDVTAPPVATPAAPEQPTPTTGAECRIKGNISSDGQKVYYAPGDPGYGSVRIDEAQGEWLFCSEQEAQAAGWRRKQ